MGAGVTDRVLAVVPVYGNDAMTHALLGDLTRERGLVDIAVVDNRGDADIAWRQALAGPFLAAWAGEAR